MRSSLVFAGLLATALALPRSASKRPSAFDNSCCCCDPNRMVIGCTREISKSNCFCAAVVCPPDAPHVWDDEMPMSASPTSGLNSADDASPSRYGSDTKQSYENTEFEDFEVVHPSEIADDPPSSAITDPARARIFRRGVGLDVPWKRVYPTSTVDNSASQGTISFESLFIEPAQTLIQGRMDGPETTVIHEATTIVMRDGTRLGTMTPGPKSAANFVLNDF